MIDIRIADINIRIHNRYSYIETMCQGYRADFETADIEAETDDLAIAEEIKNTDFPTEPPYAEAACLHREIAERLWRYDCLLLHSAVIECDGVGYAFAARSGVGKSTHISLWKKNFRERVRAINGDKPVVKITGQGVIVFGTPWNGKEGLGENRFCPLRALCFLERGENNQIESMTSAEAVSRLFPQVYLPENSQAAARTLELLDTFVKEVSFFRLSCNMEDEAAVVAHEAMSEV